MIASSYCSICCTARFDIHGGVGTSALSHEKFSWKGSNKRRAVRQGANVVKIRRRCRGSISAAWITIHCSCVRCLKAPAVVVAAGFCDCFLLLLILLLRLYHHVRRQVRSQILRGFDQRSAFHLSGARDFR